MSDEHVANWAAGIAAIFAGLSWLSWAILNAATRGQMEVAGPAVSLSVIRLGELLTVNWNLCLIPGALLLLQWLRDEAPNLMLIFTVLGVISLTFWAYGGATRGITASLEMTYILLSGVWWLGTGFLLRLRRRAFGVFTIILGVLAVFDAFVSFLEPAPLYLLAPAGLKNPLSTLWSFWLGVILLRRAGHAAAHMQ